MSDMTKPASERPFLDRYFGLTENGTDVRTEFIAGITTFLTMVYIVFVNPQILANAGMDKGAVFVATCIAAAVSTLVMAFYANYPIALAPGMTAASGAGGAATAGLGGGLLSRGSGARVGAAPPSLTTLRDLSAGGGSGCDSRSLACSPIAASTPASA